MRGTAVVEKNAMSTNAAVDNMVPATTAHTACELMYLNTALYRPNLMNIKILIGSRPDRISQWLGFENTVSVSRRITKAAQKEIAIKRASTTSVITLFVLRVEFKTLFIACKNISLPKKPNKRYKTFNASLS